jgi:hypothetical protein
MCFGVAGRCSLKALIAFFYPSSNGPSIYPPEGAQTIFFVEVQNPKKRTVFLPAPPKVVRVSVEQKGFSCHFNERLRYKLSFTRRTHACSKLISGFIQHRQLKTKS